MLNVEPNVLSPELYEGANGNRSDKCDCFCPDDRSSIVASTLHSDGLVSSVDLYVEKLTPLFTLMFNPLHGGRVAILNQSAQQIWERFRSPVTLQSLYPIQKDPISSVVDQMLTAGLLEAAGTQMQVRKSAPQTLGVWLHVTNACNLHCDYCYVDKTNETMSLETGRAAVDAAIRSTLKNGFKAVKLKFAGGEPTLKIGLVLQLHSYARQQAALAGLELDAVILTNAVSISDRTISELAARGIRVMVSLDGVGETNDRQRRFANGKGSFSRVSATLERLVASGIEPFVSITVSDRNAGGLPEVVSYLLDRDLPFNFNFFRPNDRVLSSADLELQEDRIIEAIYRAFAVIEAKLPSYSLLGSLLDRSQLDHPRDRVCSVGDSYLVVDHHGQVAKCHMELGRSITDVYSDDPLALVREDRVGIQNLSVEEKAECRDCEWRYWCAGGCPGLTFRATGRYDVKSPYCRIYKAVLPGLLRLEGLRLLKLHGLDLE